MELENCLIYKHHQSILLAAGVYVIVENCKSILWGESANLI